MSKFRVERRSEPVLKPRLQSKACSSKANASTGEVL
jgi:hypothetical protein